MQYPSIFSPSSASIKYSRSSPMPSYTKSIDNQHEHISISSRIDAHYRQGIDKLKSSQSQYCLNDNDKDKDNGLLMDYTEHIYNQYKIDNPFKYIPRPTRSVLHEVQHTTTNNNNNNNNSNRMIQANGGTSSTKKAIKITKKPNPNTNLNINVSCKSEHQLRPIAAPNSPAYSSVVSGFHNFNNLYTNDPSINTNNNVDNHRGIKVHSQVKQSINKNNSVNSSNRKMPIVTPIKGIILKKSMLNLSSTEGRTKQRHYRSRTGVTLTAHQQLTKSIIHNKSNINNNQNSTNTNIKSKMKTIADQIMPEHLPNNRQLKQMHSFLSRQSWIHSNDKIEQMSQSVNENVWVSEFDCGSLDNIKVPNLQTPQLKTSTIMENADYANKFFNFTAQPLKFHCLSIHEGSPSSSLSAKSNYSICPLCSEQIPLRSQPRPNNPLQQLNQQEPYLSQIQQHEQTCQQLSNLYKMNQQQLYEYLQWKINQHLVYIVNILGRTEVPQHNRDDIMDNNEDGMTGALGDRQYVESIMQQCQSEMAKCIWFQQVKDRLRLVSQQQHRQSGQQGNGNMLQ